jgi:hypothetical protein
MMCCALLLGASLAANVGAQTPASFKIGDKVESNISGTWQPGTIVQQMQNSSGKFYLVNADGESHSWDRWASAEQVRKATGLLSPTAMAHNELVALGEMKPPAKGSIDEALQHVIRDRYVSQGTSEFPVTVTFQGLVVGKTHRYGGPDTNGESADGPGGTAGTIVYPVSAQYYYRTAFRDAYLTSQQDNVFYCFKDAFSKWQCNLGPGKSGLKKWREERMPG